MTHKIKAGWISLVLISVVGWSCTSFKNQQLHPSLLPVRTAKPTAMTTHNPDQDDYLENLLAAYPDYFSNVLANRKAWRVQIIYTQIDRDKKGRAHFTDHPFNLDSAAYYYPASTVKFPIAVLALQKLNQLKTPGLNRSTTMLTEVGDSGQTGVYNDPTSADGRPSVEQYIRKIFMVSDNDAFNRLYEFLGQQYINENLRDKGYNSAQILHRLTVSMPESGNRKTNPIRFIDSTGQTLYQQPQQISKWEYDHNRQDLLGNGFLENGQLMNRPFDFSSKNRFSLSDLHQLLKNIYFPGPVPPKDRFDLTAADYEFLYRSMSTLPRESQFPYYDTADYPDTYVKNYMRGNPELQPAQGVRIFNKTGTAYGFLIDASYVADFTNHVEFMLSAVIYCNSDGILNDDQYDYDSVGYPFLQHLAKVIHAQELTRKRKYQPDLSSFSFQYGSQ